jgi:hypothetical protein
MLKYIDLILLPKLALIAGAGCAKTITDMSWHNVLFYNQLYCVCFPMETPRGKPEALI